ncbi:MULTISPECIES: chaplin [unclassified Streptomyces]|uniref:chaplin n=1 Tax=unclassified Streptomyces TaxID=2593676 RepID=UPI0033AF25DB
MALLQRFTKVAILSAFSAVAVFGGTTAAIANPPPPVPDPATNSQPSTPSTTDSQRSNPWSKHNQPPSTPYSQRSNPWGEHSNLQVPINIPINICGNAIGIPDVPAFQSRCINTPHQYEGNPHSYEVGRPYWGEGNSHWNEGSY